MPVTGGADESEDFDPRNHKSFLVKGFERESLIVATDMQRPAINALLAEAREFRDDWLEDFCIRNGAIQSANRGERAKLMAQVAVHDEALRRLEAEDTPRTTVV